MTKWNKNEYVQTAQEVKAGKLPDELRSEPKASMQHCSWNPEQLLSPLL